MERSPLLEQFYNSMCVEKQGFFRVNMENSPYLQFYNSVAGDFYQVCSPNQPKSQVGNLTLTLYGVLKQIRCESTLLKACELCI